MLDYGAREAPTQLLSSFVLSCLARAGAPGSLLGDKVKGQKTAGHPPSVLKAQKINRRNISMAFFSFFFFFPCFLSPAGSSANPAEPWFRIGSLRLFLLVCSRFLGTRLAPRNREAAGLLNLIECSHGILVFKHKRMVKSGSVGVKIK